MAEKQARKMAGKRAFRIKDKNVLSAAPVSAQRFERFSQSVLFILKRKMGNRIGSKRVEALVKTAPARLYQ